MPMLQEDWGRGMQKSPIQVLTTFKQRYLNAVINQDLVYQYDTLLVKLMIIKTIQHHLFRNDDLRYTPLVEVNQAN